MTNDLRTLFAAYNALRKTRDGGRNGGRPRKLERCACGKYTVKRCPKGHVCGE